MQTEIVQAADIKIGDVIDSNYFGNPKPAREVALVEKRNNWQTILWIATEQSFDWEFYRNGEPVRKVVA